MNRRDDLRARFHDLGVWEREGERAPYKPLLLLYVLGRYGRGAPRLVAYEKLDPELLRLFREFEPPRSKYNPVYPFWYLRSDGVWEVPGAEAVHDDILAAVGLEPGEVVPVGRRDPRFRSDVLRAYQRRCAVCAFDARLGDALVGLEAAHIQWHQAGGPAVVSNGLALCSLHHKLLDRGAFTLTEDHRVRVSEDLHGSEGTETWILRFHGRALEMPRNPSHRPGQAFIAWHRREVFREPGLWLEP